MAFAIGASNGGSLSVLSRLFGCFAGEITGSSIERASENLRVKNSCEARLYAFEMSEDDRAFGDREDTEDDSC